MKTDNIDDLKTILETFYIKKPFRTSKEYDVDEIMHQFFGVEWVKTKKANLGYSAWLGADVYESKKEKFLFKKEICVGPASSIRVSVIINNGDNLRNEEFVLFEQKYGTSITKITEEQLYNILLVILESNN